MLERLAVDLRETDPRETLRADFFAADFFADFLAATLAPFLSNFYLTLIFLSCNSFIKLLSGNYWEEFLRLTHGRKVTSVAGHLIKQM